MCKSDLFFKTFSVKPDCRCSVSGDPHYRTFDGEMIHFMGICKYTLAASTKEAPNFFAVEVKNEHRGNTRVSYTRLVDIKLKNVIIRLMPGNKMLVSRYEQGNKKQNIKFNTKFEYNLTSEKYFFRRTSTCNLHRIAFISKNNHV